MPSPSRLNAGQRDRRTGEQHQPPRRHQPRVQRIGQHVAPGRRRRRNADAEKAQRRLDDDRHTEMRRGKNQIRRHALRQDVPRHHAHMRGAETARRLDIREFLQRQHHGANHPSAERYSRDGDSHDHRAHARAERHRDGHCQDQVRERLQELDEALADDVEAPAEIAARQSPQRAERGAQQHRAGRHGQRGACCHGSPGSACRGRSGRCRSSAAPMAAWPSGGSRRASDRTAQAPAPRPP